MIDRFIENKLSRTEWGGFEPLGLSAARFVESVADCELKEK